MKVQSKAILPHGYDDEILGKILIHLTIQQYITDSLLNTTREFSLLFDHLQFFQPIFQFGDAQEFVFQLLLFFLQCQSFFGIKMSERVPALSIVFKNHGVELPKGGSMGYRH